MTEDSVPGSFLVRNEALVMAFLENDGLLWVGDRAILIPIGPSSGWPDGLYSKEFLIPFVICKQIHMSSPAELSAPSKHETLAQRWFTVGPAS